jgi:hypothetical protein
MGFTPRPKTYRLVFDDPDYAGAEVVCSSAPLGALLEMGDTIEDYRKFGDDYLVSWNLETDGEPIPATGEGLLSTGVDIVFARALLRAWAQALTGASAPLDSASSNGNGTATASIPMVELSAESLPN